MTDSLTQEKPMPDEKGLSTEQYLRYAEDLARIYEAERSKRKALEQANKRLRQEMEEREAVEKKLLESEKKYRSLFEESRDSIYITDPEGRFLDANPACLRLFGYPEREITNHSITEHYIDIETERIFLREMEEKGAVRDFEIRLRTSAGAIMDCLVTCTARSASTGRLLGYHGIVRDITVRKRAEEVLQHAGKMEALGKMGQAIAHEVRNPLAISSSFAQLLLDDDAPAHFRRTCSRKIIYGINRASLIIENLLIFTRPIEDFIKTRLDLALLVRNALKSIEREVGDLNIELVVHLSDAPLFVEGNYALLKQVCGNLFISALDAMPHGGVLTVELAASGAEARLTVANTGSGITLTEIETILDPSFATSGTGKGPGMGLSVSYSIMRRHDGYIHVNGAAGKGTTFLVGLPLMDQAGES
jgi:PAS domain S-box-containing protein